MTADLKGALRAFFQHDVSLRRDGRRLRLVLHDRSGNAPPPQLSAAEQAAEREARELALARTELEQLLDEGGNMRPALRHLAFVEHALGKRGFRGLHKVPLPVLLQALRQFEQLVSNWSPQGLACLRSKMAVAAHERRDEAPDDDALRVAALLDDAPALAARAIEAARSPGDAADASAAAADVDIDDETAALHAAYGAMGVDAATAS